MKFKFNALYAILCTLFILSSCGGSKDGGDKTEAFDEAQTLEERITHLVSEDFPRPSEIPYLVMQTGAEYNQLLLNNQGNADAYITRPDDAALNLGVYAADMGYLASYDKTQESMEYFQTCKRIADELGIMSGFDPAMVDSVDKNIGNRVALTRLLDKAVDQASQYMGTGANSKIGALIITGSFVESMHLATGIVNTYPKEAFTDPKQRMQILTPIITLVLKQKSSVKEVRDMLTKVDQTSRVTKILKDWEELDAAYTALEPLQEQIHKNPGNLQFNDQTLAGISTTIEKIRADITK
ncbi:MAG: hypothetical protein JNN04_07360 [Cyclobacteriaceae bacterium]|nr:hypothetical protein [Cyclobacteriaceae bacterium]